MYLSKCVTASDCKQVNCSLVGLLACGMLFSIFMVSVASAKVDVAFYYGLSPRVIDFQNYDWLVVQKDHVTERDQKKFSRAGVDLIAYISFGEVANNARYYGQVKQDWILQENAAWNSQILDWTNLAVQEFIVDVLAEEIFDKGYNGLFLDTLDSYLMTPKGRDNPEAFQKALASMIFKIKERYPGTIIIANRGFESLPLIKDKISALAFESWYSGYRIDEDEYYRINDSDREWISTVIKRKMAGSDLPIIAIDYVPENDFILAKATVDDIVESGYIPWVADPHLISVGRGRFEPFSRSILSLYNSKRLSFRKTAAHKWLQTPLEYLGYTLRFVDIDAKWGSLDGLPDFVSSYQYAGIVIWDSDVGRLKRRECDWLLKQSNSGVPVVFLGRVPRHDACRRIMPGKFEAIKVHAAEMLSTDFGYGEFEGNLKTTNITGVVYQADAESDYSWCTLKDDKGREFSPVVHGDWGGLAQNPFIFEMSVKARRWWLFDPIQFLKRSLKLAEFPIPDVTTENGRRIVTIHIDGDGLVSQYESVEGGLAGEVMLREVLEKYPVPHTVSVIEGETGKEGIYLDRREASEAVSRKIFALPWVEIASHTYSHPFYWGIFEGVKVPKSTLYGYHMNIPDYQAKLEREIRGSVDYINRELAPPNKEVEVFLWSGDALPGRLALEMADSAGLYHVNGGNTQVLPHTNSLTNVYPIGADFGSTRQIYAPVMNENVYTEDWTGPFYGFRNVVTTFKLLDEPRRLKPMSIYYHFYSATKPSALNALLEVYEWTLKRPRNVLYLSDYAKRANTFFETSITALDSDRWLLKHSGVLNTYRIPLGMGYPDFARSEGVLGFTDINNERYVSTQGKEVILALTPDRPNSMPSYLISSNALIQKWQWREIGDRRVLEVEMQSGELIELRINLSSQCKVSTDYREFVYPELIRNEGISRNKSLSVEFRFQQKQIGGPLLECSY